MRGCAAELLLALDAAFVRARVERLEPLRDRPDPPEDERPRLLERFDELSVETDISTLPCCALSCLGSVLRSSFVALWLPGPA